MQRWRARCGLMLRSFPALERLSVAQMHSKARHQAYGKANHEPERCEHDRILFPKWQGCIFLKTGVGFRILVCSGC